MSLLVYLPEYSRYKDLDYKNNNKENIIKILNNLDIKIIDPDQKILKMRKIHYIFPFGMSGHFTEKVITKLQS